MLVVRRFAFFEFNLKAAALILAPLGVALISLTRVKNGGNVVFCSPDSPILSHQIIQDDPRHAGRGEDRKSHPATILLAAGDGDVLSTTREQKHLLHHRGHRRYRHCSQIAPRVLTHFPVVWIATGPEDTFLASKN